MKAAGIKVIKNDIDKKIKDFGIMIKNLGLRY
jgi:hypothetical protein